MLSAQPVKLTSLLSYSGNCRAVLFPFPFTHLLIHCLYDEYWAFLCWHYVLFLLLSAGLIIKAVTLELAKCKQKICNMPSRHNMKKQPGFFFLCVCVGQSGGLLL